MGMLSDRKLNKERERECQHELLCLAERVCPSLSNSEKIMDLDSVYLGDTETLKRLDAQEQLKWRFWSFV